MPFFEYQCRECSHLTTFLEKAGSPDPHACEKCGSPNTEKVLSAAAVQSTSASSLPQAPPCAEGGSCPSGGCPYA